MENAGMCCSPNKIGKHIGIDRCPTPSSGQKRTCRSIIYTGVWTIAEVEDG